MSAIPLRKIDPQFRRAVAEKKINNKTGGLSFLAAMDFIKKSKPKKEEKQQEEISE